MDVDESSTNRDVIEKYRREVINMVRKATTSSWKQNSGNYQIGMYGALEKSHFENTISTFNTLNNILINHTVINVYKRSINIEAMESVAESRLKKRED